MSKQMPEGKRATFLEIALSAALVISNNLFVSYTSYLSYYLTGIIGVGVVWASSFLTVFRVWDGFTDLGVGFALDKTNTRFGKFVPYAVIGTAGMVILTRLMIVVPISVPDALKFPAFIVLYLIFSVFITCSSAASRAIAQVITDSSKDRATYGMVQGIYLTLTYSFMPILVYSFLLPQNKGFSLGFFKDLWLITSVAAVITAFLYLIVFIKKDVKQEDPSAKKTQKNFRIKDALPLIAHNRPLQMMILSAGTDKLATMMQGNATVVIIMYAIVAGNSKLGSAVASYTTIPSIIMIILGLGGIGRKLGNKKALVISSIGGIVTCALSIVLWVVGDPHTLTLPGFEGFNGWTAFALIFLILWCVMKGFAMIGQAAVNPLIADVIDYETYRSGNYCPGIISNLFGFADKMISSLGTTIIGLMCAAIGFTTALPNADTAYSVKLLIVGLVGMYGIYIFGLAVNLIAMHFYDLTPERMDEIHAELQKRRYEANTY